MIAVTPGEEDVNYRGQNQRVGAGAVCRARSNKGHQCQFHGQSDCEKRGAAKSGPVNAGECPTYLGVF